MRRPNITAHDLMDSNEVAEAFGISTSSLRVALHNPDIYPALADQLPPPLRKIGNSHVWLRYDIEKAAGIRAAAMAT
jgi:predicted DNA-binding transcriptional regulator AlpA